MDINEEREQFLADQARKFGEAIELFAFARKLSGPLLGSEMIFLLVGASALHLLPSAHEASMFGISLGSKNKAPAPEPTSLAREQVVQFMAPVAQSWWKRLTSPQEVVCVKAVSEGGEVEWQFQLLGGAERFVADWRALWS